MNASSPQDPTGDCDVVVVGGGIVGLATARELQQREPGRRIVVLEREDRLGRHQTGSNSGVLHAGIYYKPGSLKAKLCVEGRRKMVDFCDEHAIPYELCGKVIVAIDPSELPRLDELESRGLANGVPGLRRLDAAGVLELEPHVTPAVAGLHSPETGIVDFGRVAQVLAGQLREAGAAVATGCDVTGFTSAGSRTDVHHTLGTTRARRVITCAGAWSDRLAVSAGADPDPRIVPFRGGYMRLAEHRRHLCRSLIYPVPDPDLPFLGVHLTKRVDGEVLLGPTALLVAARDGYRLSTMRTADIRATLSWPGTYRMARRWWRTGLAEMHMAARKKVFVDACARYVPELTEEDVLPGPAGVRAQAVGRDGSLVDDFIFSEAGGALHVRNAPSPAATSSLAIAGLIADRAQAALA